MELELLEKRLELLTKELEENATHYNMMVGRYEEGKYQASTFDEKTPEELKKGLLDRMQKVYQDLGYAKGRFEASQGAYQECLLTITDIKNKSELENDNISQ